MKEGNKLSVDSERIAILCFLEMMEHDILQCNDYLKYTNWTNGLLSIKDFDNLVNVSVKDRSVDSSKDSAKTAKIQLDPI